MINKRGDLTTTTSTCETHKRHALQQNIKVIYNISVYLNVEKDYLKSHVTLRLFSCHNLEYPQTSTKCFIE